MAAYRPVHDYACVSPWAWWEVVAAHHQVHDYACVSPWAWWEVVAAHHRVHDYACCHLQADCLKSVSAPAPYARNLCAVPCETACTFTFTLQPTDEMIHSERSKTVVIFLCCRLYNQGLFEIQCKKQSKSLNLCQ